MSLWHHTSEKTVGMFNWRNYIMAKLAYSTIYISYVKQWDTRFNLLYLSNQGFFLFQPFFWGFADKLFLFFIMLQFFASSMSARKKSYLYSRHALGKPDIGFTKSDGSLWRHSRRGNGTKAGERAFFTLNFSDLRSYFVVNKPPYLWLFIDPPTGMAKSMCNCCQTEVSGHVVKCAECPDFDLCLQVWRHGVCLSLLTFGFDSYCYRLFVCLTH